MVTPNENLLITILTIVLSLIVMNSLDETLKKKSAPYVLILMVVIYILIRVFLIALITAIS
jgi:hypothetical protein